MCAQETATESTGIDRWSFGTNAIEWLFTIPNFRVTYDISSSKYNHLVAMLDVKYNWNTWQNTDAYFVFNVFDIRPEVRRYFRTTTIDTKKHPDGKVPWTSNQKEKPRTWRAYYVGAYADYTQYSLKPGGLGRQGNAFGIGLSFGYEIPMYTYKNGAVDLDLGVSAGVLYHRDEAYVLTDESAYYQASDAKQVFPVLPMLTELRAVFSWRHKSVSRKYLEENPMDGYYRDQKKIIDQDYSEYSVDAYWNSRDSKQKDALNRSDSLYRASYIQYVDEWEEFRTRVVNEDYTLDQSTKKKLGKYIHSRANRLRMSFNKKAVELKEARHKKENEARAKQKEADKMAKAEQKKLDQAEKEKQKEQAKLEKEEAKNKQSQEDVQAEEGQVKDKKAKKVKEEKPKKEDKTETVKEEKPKKEKAKKEKKGKKENNEQNTAIQEEGNME